MNSVKVRNLRFSYGERIVLEDISFEVNEGEILNSTRPKRCW